MKTTKDSDLLQGTPTCFSCIHLMTGADNIQRCRVHPHAAPVSPALEAGCTKYVREPGTDDETAPWYAEAWEQGRGD